MAVQECPNCFLKILPNADGTCPACNGDLNATQGDRASIWISKDMVVPRLCCTCAAVTDAQARFRSDEFGEKPPSTGWAWFFSTLLMMVGVLFGWIFFMFPGEEEVDEGRVVTGRVPQCSSCQARQKITPREIDFHRGAVKLVVHRHFADRFRELNKTA